MKKFIISEEEKSRILGMHVEATKRHYGLVNEQLIPTPVTDSEGNPYLWAAIKDKETLDKFKKEGDSLDKIVALIGSTLIYGPAAVKGTGLDLDEKYKQDALRNIYKGLDMVAKLGRKVKGEDIDGILVNTSSKYEPGMVHDSATYAGIINKLADAISTKLNLQPKLA